jgi:hypothetical protein
MEVEIGGVHGGKGDLGEAVEGREGYAVVVVVDDVREALSQVAMGRNCLELRNLVL